MLTQLAPAPLEATDSSPFVATDPFESPGAKPSAVNRRQKLITLAIVLSPAVALGSFIPLRWGHAVNLTDIVMGIVFYLVTGFGVTIGFHRLLTHRSFKSCRLLKIALAAFGSMAIEGSVTSWVATHRRHHIYSDSPGDPHSPHRYGERGIALLRGLAFSHVGWLFVSDASNIQRYAPDMLRDRDIRRIGKLFPLFAAASLAIPFGIGYLLAGTWVGAVSALVWAGVVRTTLLHHVTWSINSICHVFGRQSEVLNDRSTNVWPLAILSLGESWHNIHHAHPSWARHGARRGMIDPSARLIRIFECLGWSSKVRWPVMSELTTSSIAA
ncbi:MAG TPA: acyl-CoA desaturase [Acidimicrobiales bacterium]|nr:acyl-CoA desaturase [Acidimicrobiales bacterium]